VQGGLAIPLPLFTRNQGRVRAAEIRIRQAELHSESVRSDLLLRLTQAYQALAAANDRVSTYRGEILPKAEKALTQTNEGHRLGKLGYLDVLDAQRTLSEARSANQAALTDLNLAALEVEKLTGLKLDSVR
jgi:cobalt-zinc-cadmium efflux system outer membrane protein